MPVNNAEDTVLGEKKRFFLQFHHALSYLVLILSHFGFHFTVNVLHPSILWTSFCFIKKHGGTIIKQLAVWSSVVQLRWVFQFNLWLSFRWQWVSVLSTSDCGFSFLYFSRGWQFTNYVNSRTDIIGHLPKMGGFLGVRGWRWKLLNFPRRGTFTCKLFCCKSKQT